MANNEDGLDIHPEPATLVHPCTTRLAADQTPAPTFIAAFENDDEGYLASVKYEAIEDHADANIYLTIKSSLPDDWMQTVCIVPSERKHLLAFMTYCNIVSVEGLIDMLVYVHTVDNKLTFRFADPGKRYEVRAA